jgi:hypothetical protein
MSKMAKGLVRKRVSSQAPENVLALAAMLIATTVTGCSTLMEPDHADAALMESNSGLSAIHHYQDSSVTGKISQRQLAAGI